MNARGNWRPGVWRILVVTAAALLLCAGFVSQAGARNVTTAWDWPSTTSFWDGSGAPFTPTLQADPTGVRKAPVLELEFDRCGYSIYVSNGPGLFHFENGKDYTLLFTVLEIPECGHNGELDVRVVASVPTYAYVQKGVGHVATVPDGVWRTVPVYLADFAGPSGDYYLHMYDQCGEGCWMIGDIRVVSGIGGHGTK